MGQATEIDIHAREILRMREITSQLIAKHSGQRLEKVERDVERDFIMNAQQGKEYGIIDDIILTQVAGSRQELCGVRL